MKQDIRDVLNELLVNMFNQILSLEEEFLKDKGIELSMSEVHTLEAIERSKGKTMSEVALALRITQGTLTVNVNRLAKKGYVYRTQDIQDRRVFRLNLTEKAQGVMSVHKKFHENMIDTIVSQLETEEKELLVNSLSQVNLFFKSLK